MRLLALLMSATTLTSMSLSSPMLALAADTPDSKNTVKVFVTAQQDGTFLTVPTELTVSKDEAEKYGYTDAVTDGVSALDVLVAEHEAILGDAFTKDDCTDYLELSSSNFITTVFGEKTSNFGFAIDGKAPHDGTFNTSYNQYNGLLINQSAVKDGQNAEFFIYQDGYALDNYADLDLGADTVEAGKTVKVNLSGYCYAYYGLSKEETIQDMTQKIENAQIGIVDAKTGEVTAIKNAVTDESGKTTFSISTPGDYMITAYMADEDDNPLIMPLKKLKVTELSALTMSQSSAKLSPGGTITLTTDADASAVKWESSDNEIATVKDGVVTGVSNGTATITASVGDVKATCSVKVINPTLRISKKSLTMENDSTYQLTANVTSADGDNNVTWTSSDESIVKVDAKGNVTAVGEGIAMISAHFAELEEVCVVKVYQTKTPESLTISADNENFKEYQGLYAYGANSGQEQKIQLKANVAPEDASATVKWSSSERSIPISEDGVFTIPAKVTSRTYVVFTATSIHDNKVTAQYKLDILPALSASKSSLTLTIPQDGIPLRQNQYISASPTQYETYNMVSYSIEDPSIADIDDSGNSVCYIIPKKAGTTTVTATYKAEKEYKATTTLTVKGFTVVDANGNSGSGSAVIGDKIQLTAQTDDKVTWTSSDDKVASVDENGLVTALAAGDAEIKAQSDNGYCTYKLTVGESGKVYPTALFTTSYSSLYTDEACTKQLTTVDRYLGSQTWTSKMHLFPVTTTKDTILYAKAGTSSLRVSFGLEFDTEKVKAELIQKKEVTQTFENAKTATITLDGVESNFTIRVTSLENKDLYTDYNYTIKRQVNDTATVKSASARPANRTNSSTKKYFSKLANRSLTEGTLFRADENGVAQKTTGFSNSWYDYYVPLFADAKAAMLTVSATDASTGHLQYSIDDGKTWTEGKATATITSEAFDDTSKTKVIVRSVSDKVYLGKTAAKEDPFADESAKTYNFYVERLPESFTEQSAFEKISFDKNCRECSPYFVAGSTVAGAVVDHDADAVTVTFQAKEGVKVYKTSVSAANLLTVTETKDGLSTYEMEIKTPLTAQGNQITQKMVVVNEDSEGNRIEDTTTLYLFKVGTTKGVLKGTPDKIVDYMCPASQYTSGGNQGWGIYGIFPEKLQMGTGNWYTCISLGNFGGYMTFYYDKPITDDANNPYGIDFTVFGNSNGGASFTEPGNILVSEDGNTWYTIAGSEHYDAGARWNYQVTYKNVDGLAEYSDNDGNSGPVSHNNAFGNMRYPTKLCYPLYQWKDGEEEQMTVTGVRLYGSNAKKGDGLELSGNGALPAFGYTDVHTNSSTTAGTGEDVNLLTTPVGNPYTASYDGYGDGIDLKWAVDAEGNPVDVSNKEFHYIKVQTASFINGGAIGEKSTEVSAVVRTTPEKTDIGTTEAPKSITVGGKQINLKEGTNVYYTNVADETAYDVSVTPAADDSNVYINNERTTTRSYSELPDKGIVRVIVQDGEKNPVIYYIHVNKDGADNLQDARVAIAALEDASSDQADAVKAARAAYDKLSDEEKAEITNYDVLVKAENKLAAAEVEKLFADAKNAKDQAKAYDEAKAAYDALNDDQKAYLSDADALESTYTAAVIAQIGKVTEDSRAAIDKARATYNALSDAQKVRVVNYQTLVNAELKYENIMLQKNRQAMTDSIRELKFNAAQFTLSNKVRTYTGKDLKVTVTGKYAGKKLVKDVDYTVTYKYNREIGTAKVVIKGKGDYKGRKVLSFKILPKKASIKSLSKGKKSFSAKWSKVSGKVTGYQVRYALKSNMSGAKKVTVSASKASLKVKNLKGGKKYFVQIRTYKEVNGKKYYSDWSKAKGVTVKK